MNRTQKVALWLTKAGYDGQLKGVAVSSQLDIAMLRTSMQGCHRPQPISPSALDFELSKRGGMNGGRRTLRSLETKRDGCIQPG